MLPQTLIWTLRQVALYPKMYLRQTALDTKRYIRQLALDTKRYLRQVALFPSGMLILVCVL